MTNASPEAEFKPSGAPEPGPFATWWWRHVRGWPDGLPFNRKTLDRARFHLLRTSVRKEMQTRFKDSGTGLAAPDGRHLLPAMLLPALIQVCIHIFRHPMLIAVAVALILIFQFLLVRRVLAQLTHPTIRASLRREGVNCCVRCGQLIEMGGDTATCPECGMPHDAFPLRWGPGEIGRLRVPNPSP